VLKGRLSLLKTIIPSRAKGTAMKRMRDRQVEIEKDLKEAALKK
jgi:hypothetical protein